jgi:hypothetical protein
MSYLKKRPYNTTAPTFVFSSIQGRAYSYEYFKMLVGLVRVRVTRLGYFLLKLLRQS